MYSRKVLAFLGCFVFCSGGFASTSSSTDNHLQLAFVEPSALHTPLRMASNSAAVTNSGGSATDVGGVQEPHPVHHKHNPAHHHHNLPPHLIHGHHKKQAPGVNQTQGAHKHGLAILGERDEPQPFHTSNVRVHAPDLDPDSMDFYPTALVADNKVVTYIAGTPIVTSPYLGARPAFDGSDYIINISSINRDIRLMQQRRLLFRTYHSIGYPDPTHPIIALSGAVQPMISTSHTYTGQNTGDITLDWDELDVAAILNRDVEAYMALAYDSSALDDWGQRLANSSIDLNMGFVNIGDLDKTPFYFTGGQLYIPFGRYATAMITPTLPLVISRTKARPFILGYKSQEQSGPYAALYIFTSDTTLGSSGVGGFNFGYVVERPVWSGEIGFGIISSVDDAAGMQDTGQPQGYFQGFASIIDGNENVQKIPAIDVHGSVRFDRFNFIAEWVTVTQAFRPQDLSFNGNGARPQALQGEIDMTFRSFDRPSSVGVSYNWSQDALALNVPKQRISAAYTISIWRDTIERIEYRHDIDYAATDYANGANPVEGPANMNILGTGKTADSIIAQIGVFF